MKIHQLFVITFVIILFSCSPNMDKKPNNVLEETQNVTTSDSIISKTNVIKKRDGIGFLFTDTLNFNLDSSKEFTVDYQYEKVESISNCDVYQEVFNLDSSNLKFINYDVVDCSSSENLRNYLIYMNDSINFWEIENSYSLNNYTNWKIENFNYFKSKEGHLCFDILFSEYCDNCLDRNYLYYSFIKDKNTGFLQSKFYNPSLEQLKIESNK